MNALSTAAAGIAIFRGMTASEQPHNDRPITEPAEDRFGIDPFALALARSIRGMKSPEGTVITLNGPWGAGKSSAVNLVLHHLKDALDKDELAVVNFACWWFRGEQALAILGDKFKKALPKIDARMLKAGSLVSAGADLAGATASVGTLASGAMSQVADFIKVDDTVEKLHAELTKVLADQDKRFLIVIDDIDRLALDEGGARGDETMLETVIPVKEISSHLATYLHPLSASLFERFGVTGLSLDRVEAELDKMKANRFGGLRSAPPPRRGRS